MKSAEEISAKASARIARLRWRARGSHSDIAPRRRSNMPPLASCSAAAACRCSGIGASKQINVSWREMRLHFGSWRAGHLDAGRNYRTSSIAQPLPRCVGDSSFCLTSQTKAAGGGWLAYDGTRQRISSARAATLAAHHLRRRRRKTA